MMRNGGRVTPPPAKRRGWIRFERLYSNALWHAGCHLMRDPRFAGLWLITHMDDASRCVVAARLVRHPASENAAAVLLEAIGQFGAPATVLATGGRCFVGAGSARSKDGRRRAPPGTGIPTAFEEVLLEHGIELINSRPRHPRTNGKLERFHRTIEEEIGHHKSLQAYIRYYNEERLHFSLDMDAYQTPLRAFHDKTAPEAIKKGNPRWMEEDVGGEAT